ncbi:hypothetical protein [Pseudomonas protegens]|uniref:hypothetical protein n=1 Tax=Pseudomonas protegens TaxID=380021 RepID=UPI000FED6B8D|nr:hypothetical protein [Pseudomonas protegens]ROL84700.1 hypothetical protein BK639_29670 [Pseudomonas protegens]ROM00575.1 hypothetical protein BK641_21145 [Pseudomonas protegens]ROM03787.1 hypothetical protein BK640_12180 [Pseudomonas protegens]ROM09770.1 hypothetical protein BK642_11120 [Pseudomonas protegens]
MALRDCAKVLLESGRQSILLLFLILVTYVPLIYLALPNWLRWLSVAAAAGCERLRSRRRS